ncbi:hypothetical protein X474_02865 [Dethiosulfatarculus sandiegensis]|uniref:Uncharacterized protein n=1 Tax=Dethiosulfatarculus sandiegensis TaxID=1429043 RepID=A0A0D2JJ82_9BACT|nr:hypothetical protein X474_02865 [Dethiosulfatarculus sandiegensis]
MNDQSANLLRDLRFDRFQSGRVKPIFFSPGGEPCFFIKKQL